MTVDPLTSPAIGGLEQMLPFASSMPPAAVSSPDAPKVAASSDSISISAKARAIAAHDGERSPAMFMLSKSEQSQLQAGESTSHGWHDDAQTGALLLRANASPSYVARYLSPQHLQQAYRLDSAHDSRVDAPLNRAVASGVQAVSDTISAGRNGVQSSIATGRVNLHPTAAEADQHRATIRERLGETLSQSSDPTVHAVGNLYANYDSSPQALRGTLDAALDTATDPLTYAAGGADAIGNMATHIAAQAPRLLETAGAAGSAALRTVDEIGAGLGNSFGSRLQAAGAGGVNSLDSASASNFGRLETRINGNSTSVNVRGSWQRDEAAGGHTLERHIGKSDTELRARLDNERIPAASTFSNEATASRARSQLNKQYGSAIDAWRSSASTKPFVATVKCDSAVGRVMMRGSDKPVQTNLSTFVLYKNDALPSQYYVHTAYPRL